MQWNCKNKIFNFIAQTVHLTENSIKGGMENCRHNFSYFFFFFSFCAPKSDSLRSTEEKNEKL